MLRRFRRNSEGATAIEFSLVVAPFFFLIMIILEMGFKSLQQAELDQRLFEVSVKLSREDDNDASRAEYLNRVVCTKLPPLITCGKLLFGAAAFPNTERLDDKINKTFVEGWDTGCGGSTIIIEMLYPVTDLVFPFAVADVVDYRGGRYFRSRGLVRREPGVKGTGTLSGGKAAC